MTFEDIGLLPLLAFVSVVLPMFQACISNNAGAI